VVTQQRKRPFANSIELLQAEIEGWVTARCHHLAAKKELTEFDAQPTLNITMIGREEATAHEELRRRIAKLAVAEANIRAEIDSRIEATKGTGIDLGLGRVCREFDLDDLERAALLLCFVQTVAVYAVEPLERVGPYGFGIGDICPDLLARYCELPFHEKVGLRLRFGAEGRLVRAGLIAVDLGRTAFPADWPTCSLKLTNKGFSALTGLQVTGDEADE
jgi:hypothetical protein